MEYDYRAIKISPALNKVFKKLNTAVLREQRSKMRDILEQLMSEALTINVPVELWLAFLLYKIKSCQKRIKIKGQADVTGNEGAETVSCHRNNQN